MPIFDKLPYSLRSQGDNKSKKDTQIGHVNEKKVL
jgi:hypothetical protein